MQKNTYFAAKFSVLANFCLCYVNFNCNVAQGQNAKNGYNCNLLYYHNYIFLSIVFLKNFFRFFWAKFCNSASILLCSDFYQAKKEQAKVSLQNNKTIQENEVSKLTEEERKLQEDIENYKQEEARIESLIQIASNDYVYSGEFTGGVMAWPVAKSGTYITSGYGIREHPIQGIIKKHTGIDIGNAGFGAPVIAAADGVVSMASYYGGYGNCVMINHGNGVSTLYGHGQKILVEVGKEVKKGDLIMEVGSTGMSTGPHLHFEVRINGTPVDPMPYLKASE